MFCRKCGVEMPDDSDYCPECGVEVFHLEEDSGGVPPPYPIRTVYDRPPVGYGMTPQARKQAGAPRPGKSRMPWAIAGTFILVAAIAVVIILAVTLGSHSIRITLKPAGEYSEQHIERSIDILKARLEALGIEDPEVSLDESGSVVIRIPGEQETERILGILTSTAQLQFREVLEVTAPFEEAYDVTEVTVPDPEDAEAYRALTDQEIVLEYEDGGGDILKVRMGPTRLTGDIIEEAEPMVDEESGGYKVVFKLTLEASRQFGDLTTELTGRQLAIVLDYELESFPTVNEPITEGEGVITGEFTRDEIRDLALVMRFGALPVEFEPDPMVEEY
jgi:protein-export membrane protein SecD